jgi:hypothetical protein
MAISKRYDNQILIDNENQERFDRYEWWNKNGSQVLSVFVNLPESEKDCWLVNENSENEEDVVLPDETIISPPTKTGFFNKLSHKWEQSRSISNAISKDVRVAWIDDNVMTTKQRQKIIEKFPTYQKRIIVYESDIDRSVYERPSLTEGFDDITFVI